MKCSYTRHATNISHTSKQSPEGDLCDEGAPNKHHISTKISNRKDRVNNLCSQSRQMAVFLNQNYSTGEEFWQIKYFLPNMTMECTEDERHQKDPWIMEICTVLADSTYRKGSQTRSQHSQIKTTFFFSSLQNTRCPLGSSVFFLSNLVTCTVWKKYAKYSATYPLIYSLAEFIVRLRDCAMVANSTASTWFLNPHRTRWCSVCLQYLEKLKTDGHKKIREITCDSAYLKEDYLEKDEIAFLASAKYSNTVFSLLPVLGILSQSRNIMSGLHSSLDGCYLWDPLLNRIHFRLLSSPSQKENLLIQSNHFESVAIFFSYQICSHPILPVLSRAPCTEHTGHALYLVADIPASINTLERGRQQPNSGKKVTLKGQSSVNTAVRYCYGTWMGSWLSGPWAWSGNPSRTPGARKLVAYSDLVIPETSYGTDPVFSSPFLTHHHLRWAVPCTEHSPSPQFVPYVCF